MVDETDRNKTIEFDDFQNRSRSEGDLSPADIQRNLEEKLKQLKDHLSELSVRGSDLLAEMHTAEGEEKAKLFNEWKAVSKQKQEVQSEAGALENLLSAHVRNTGLSTTLHNIQAGSRGNEEVKTSLETDAAGNLRLVVEQLKPTPFSFKISDGQLTFDDVGVSKEQLAEMLGTLEKMGIKNIRLPDGLDKRLHDNLSKAQEERREAENAAYSREGGAPNLLSAEAPANDDFPIRPGEASTLDMPAPKEEPKFSYDYKEFKHKVEFDILQRNMGKKEGLSFFHQTENGYDKWYVYDSENPNNYSDDGAIGKDGSIKTKHAFVIWAKEKKDGSLELGYSMPPGKNISNALADKLISLHKDRGYTHIKFNDLTDDDAGTFRIRCAQMGIIPIGIGINEKHAAKMVSEAEGKLSSGDLQKFKWRLAQQMRANLRKQGKSIVGDRTEGYIYELEGNYNFTPFKQAYDDVIKKMMDEEKRSGKAENAIGSAYALEKVFEAYRGGELDSPRSVTLGQVLKPESQIFTEEEINAIKARFSGQGRPLDLDKTMNAISKEDMGEIFQAILPIQQKQVERDLADKIQGYDNKKDKDEAVKEEISTANEAVSRVFGELETKGIKKPYIAPINRGMKFGGKSSQAQSSRQVNPALMNNARSSER